MVSYDPSLKRNQRLLCQKCLDSLQVSTKVEGFNKTLSTIQENHQNRVNSQQFLIEKSIQFIEPLQQEIQSIRDKFVNILDTIIKFTADWKMELQQISKKPMVLSFFAELESLVYRQQDNMQQVIFDQINKLNQTYSKSIINQLPIIKEDPFKEIELKLNNSEKMLNNEFLQFDFNVQIKNNKKSPISINLKEIKRVESEKGISHIIFDKTGQMMITINEGKIGVWKFASGNLEQQASWVAHQSDIKCAILSCNQNPYILTAADMTIKISLRINEMYWKSDFESQKLDNHIGCMIISRNEDYLFTSCENVISIWRLNYTQKKWLTFQYSLKQHKWAINAMSINKSENKLVSCSKNKQLIIWGLNKNNQWEYKYDVKQSILDIGNALYFLKDSQFILLSGELDTQDNVYVYEEQNEQFQEVLKKTLKLPKIKGDSSISPIVYIDQQQNILLISQKNDLYLILEKSDGSFYIIKQINRIIDIHQQSQSLAQDGKYLVYSKYDNRDNRNYLVVNEIQY
ncbi:unnamed protein product (macronuclear) [Paramecium tetraurelia]|uniref:Uncharacterized protein n=1 Tax=Paramecium tetraurelia TaxID=5888 RepID=A0EAC9_PARTE|nr:uncharacterized protein GSPATT00024978001 [Paramecium tetraurelia]CAK92246.1 unnamed protein product [Paramecium tetraurelia]|eukprot:XP_001459643.1 hypothetical protein (macronuclear) [Paramecium tetraurelia strain d4-2]